MRNPRLFTLLIVGVACFVAVFTWWCRYDTGVPPEAATASSSGGNPYVDESACAECHPRQTSDHQGSGHADTFRLSRGSPLAKQLAGRVFKDPERGYSYHYHLDNQNGLSVSIPEVLGEDRFRLEYALGSGQHALTFLTLVPDRFGDTIGIEHRISMYRGQGDWELDLTPGHQRTGVGEAVEHFGRITRGDTLTGCIGCHTVTSEIRGHQLTELRPNVGCQSCHGPGREHMIATQSGESDKYSSSGLTEQTAVQEIELCGRCHRLPSNDPPSERLSPNILQNVRFQPAGLLQSRCFQASGTLRCSTCHDPHQHVSRDRGHYQKSCLRCHGQPESTVCPVSPKEDCIRCHMPAIDVHRGIKFHDHWIRVRHDLGSARE